MSNEWHPLGVACRHCGAPLDGRRKKPHPDLIWPPILTPVEYRHANGERHCAVVFEAGPYDDWKAAAAFDLAVANREEESE